MQCSHEDSGLSLIQNMDRGTCDNLHEGKVYMVTLCPSSIIVVSIDASRLRSSLSKPGSSPRQRTLRCFSLAIFVDVRLRETVVIVCDCRTISLIMIFLCLGYIHFGGKGTLNFSTDKTGECSILGIFPNIRRK